MKTKIIVLCGSSKYTDIMAVAAWLLEKKEGAITMGLHLLPDWYFEKPVSDHLAEHEGVAPAMDELHMCKIDLCDEIFVINYNDYIGSSTTNEIKYAQKHGKPIRWYTHDDIGQEIDEILKEAQIRFMNININAEKGESQ